MSTLTLGACAIPPPFKSWVDVQLSMRSAGAWRRVASRATVEYVGFLRKGVECGTCRSVLPQSVFHSVHVAARAPAVAATTMSSATEPITIDLDDSPVDGSACAAVAGAASIDLTEDAPDDPSAPPPGMPPNPVAEVRSPLYASLLPS